jgi:hypothetical protein
MPKPRQVRVQLTGGIADLEEWAQDLAEIADERGFVQHFEDGPKRFGDHGPLHKYVAGYVQRP